MKDLPYKKIYFVGIKGVGVASLAVIAKQAGIEVQGSDVSDVFITDKMLASQDIVVDSGFEPDKVSEFFANSGVQSAIVYSAAHGGEENVQVKRGKELGANVFSYGKALGLFQSGELLSRSDIKGISVAGSHGKTTTSAMLATVLKVLGEDPSYLIGTGEVSSLGFPGHYGKGQYFVAESDEYFSDLNHDRIPKFHYQHPDGAIITNIDFDHPDVFENLDDVYVAFEKFASNIMPGGALVILGDNEDYSRVSNKVQNDVKVITYGRKNKNDYQAININSTENGITYDVMHDSEIIGTVKPGVIGVHNAVNSLAVVALLHSLGMDMAKISEGLSKFNGTKRRLEIKGTNRNGVLVLDDYAHHPVEVRATLSAIKNSYPLKKIICIFQPHTYSRTVKLIDGFSHAFNDVEKLIILPIFPSAREGMVIEADQKKLYNQIIENTAAEFLKSTHNVLEYVTQNYNSEEYLVVTMGAGDVYKIADSLIASS